MAVRLAFALLVALPVFSLASATGQAQNCDPRQVTCFPEPSGPTFKIAAYNGTIVRDGGKCLTYAAAVPGASVYLSDCDVAQAFRVQEVQGLTDVDGLPIRNHVYLFAGNLVLGVKSIRLGPRRREALGRIDTPTIRTTSLELQTRGQIPDKLGGSGEPGANQVFALDGDSIILAADRSKVVQVRNGRGADGAPVVLGPRALADWEFWEFRATSGADIDPTPSFWRVGDLEGLRQHLHEQYNYNFFPPQPATFGTVIRVTDSFDYTLGQALEVPSGVTIRGDRRGTRFTSLIHLQKKTSQAIFVLAGHDIRITNMRLRGPNTARSRSSDLEAEPNRGILIADRTYQDHRTENLRVYIDNNDLSDFHIQAILVEGGDDLSNGKCDQFGPQPNWSTRPTNVHVVRNFLHHNVVQGSGYGVNAKSGGYPLISGNTFVTNRHAIAATNSTPRTGYLAIGNLVLRHVPVQEWGPFNYLTHDFDVHGTGDDGKGEIAGGHFEVSSNTFLGLEDVTFSPHHNFEIRGESCAKSVHFFDNISLQEKEDAVSYDGEDLPGWIHVAASPNQFEHSNPTRLLRSGDFDGDGYDDLFLATGTAFYYSPGGASDWRLLATGRTDSIESLRFGDFDGDGRTDVIGKNGGRIMVSWGGSAEWEVLNYLDAPITDLAVGNFDGGEQDDIFYSNGQGWYVSSGGSGPFDLSATSGFRLPNLRFGDFNGDGETDVLGHVGGDWSVSYGARSTWTELPVTLTTSVERLLIGDFNGDGRDDIATWERDLVGLYEWKFWHDDISNWTKLTTSATGPLAGIGRFRGDLADDLLFWDYELLIPFAPQPSDHIYIDYFGSKGREVYSRQAMR